MIVQSVSSGTGIRDSSLGDRRTRQMAASIVSYENVLLSFFPIPMKEEALASLTPVATGVGR